MKSKLTFLLCGLAGLAVVFLLYTLSPCVKTKTQCFFSGFQGKPKAPALSTTTVKPKELPKRYAQLAVGEEARYSLRWLGIEVGESRAVLKEIVPIEGRPAYHIVVFNRSNPFLDLIFKVRDEYHSYLDVEDLKTLRFEKIVHEGNYRADEEIDFDHVKGEGRYHSRINGGRKTFKIEPGVADGIGAIYKYRLLPVSPEKETQISITWDEKSYDLRIPVVGRETISHTVLGSQEAFRLKPYIPNTKDPNIKSSRVLIWVSASKKRIPLRMKTQVPIAGSVNAVLVDYRASS